MRSILAVLLLTTWCSVPFAVANAMDKKELVAYVIEVADVSPSQAARAVDAVFNGITKALIRGEEVRLVGFGTFNVVHRRATQGRNPRTGEPIQIPASNQPKFRAGKGLKSAVN